MSFDIRNLDYFYYSQNSLTAFLRCPLNFKYKYIDGLSFKGDSEWEEEYNAGLKKGLDFHLLCERYFLGIEDEKEFKNFGEIGSWACKSAEKVSLVDGDKCFPEYTIKMKKDSIKLQAEYDLIVIRKDGRIEIWDWKSESKRLTYAKAIEKFQTIVYMYVLFESLKKSFDIEAEPENISMRYYQPGFGDDSVDIAYSQKRHIEFENKIKNIISKIESCDFEGSIENLRNEENCRYCEFKNICRVKKL